MALWKYLEKKRVNDLPGDRIGDIVVISEESSIGINPDHHDFLVRCLLRRMVD